MPHGVTYSTQGDVPVAIVVRSLMANEKLMYDAVSILDEIFEGFQVELSSVKVKEVSNSSPLKEILAGIIIVTFQDDLKKEIPSFIEGLLGIDVPSNYETILTVITMVIAVYSISTLYSRIFPSKDATELKREYDRKLQEASDLLKITSTDLKIIIEDKGESKLQSWTKAATDFFSPAKLEGSVLVTGNGGYEISQRAIEEIPNQLDLVQEQVTGQYLLDNMDIELHSWDSDYIRKGWAGIIQSESSKRIKMHLSPEIDQSELIGKTKIKGNVLVETKKQENGDFIPIIYHLINVISTQD